MEWGKRFFFWGGDRIGGKNFLLKYTFVPNKRRHACPFRPLQICYCVIQKTVKWIEWILWIKIYKTSAWHQLCLKLKMSSRTMSLGSSKANLRQITKITMLDFKSALLSSSHYVLGSFFVSLKIMLVILRCITYVLLYSYCHSLINYPLPKHWTFICL